MQGKDKIFLYVALFLRINFYFHRFGGKPCDMNTLMEEKQCDYSKTPDCDKIQRTASRWGEWGEWSDCAGACGKYLRVVICQSNFH